MKFLNVLVLVARWLVVCVLLLDAIETQREGVQLSLSKRQWIKKNFGKGNEKEKGQGTYMPEAPRQPLVILIPNAINQ